MIIETLEIRFRNILIEHGIVPANSTDLVNAVDVLLTETSNWIRDNDIIVESADEAERLVNRSMYLELKGKVREQ